LEVDPAPRSLPISSRASASIYICSTFEPWSGMKIVSSDTPFALNPASTSANTAEERPAFSYHGCRAAGSLPGVHLSPDHT